jgi:hypothetical protein
MNNPTIYAAVITGMSASTQNFNASCSAAQFAVFKGNIQLLAALVDNLIPVDPAIIEEDAHLMHGITAGLQFNRLMVLPSPGTISSIAADIVKMWTEIRNALGGADALGRWDDLVGTVGQAAAVAGLVYQFYGDTPFMMYFFRHDRDEALSLSYHMSHRWNLRTVSPHIHLRPCSPSDGTVVLDGRYAWSLYNNGQNLPMWAGWTPFRVEVPLLGADQYKEGIATLFNSDPPAAYRHSSATLHIYLRRPGASDAADTYQGGNPYGLAQANLGISFVDCHHKTMRHGTVTEFGV